MFSTARESTVMCCGWSNIYFSAGIAFSRFPPYRVRVFEMIVIQIVPFCFETVILLAIKLIDAVSGEARGRRQIEERGIEGRLTSQLWIARLRRTLAHGGVQYDSNSLASCSRYLFFPDTASAPAESRPPKVEHGTF
jgi:hypothetical protein